MARGRETQFFMTRRDEEAFVEFLLPQGDIGLVRDRYYERPEFEVYNDAESFFQQPVANENKAPMWYIWHRTHEPTLSYDEIRPGMLDIRFGALIIFERCVEEHGGLESGRIACLENYEDEDGLPRRRSEAFCKWYQKLRRWLLKHSVRSSFDGIEAGGPRILPGALDYHNRGGRLGLVPNWPFQPLKKDVS